MRLAINVSPEPVSNWLSSIREDLSVLGGIWLMFNHPAFMLTLVVLFIALAVWLIPKIFHMAKVGFQKFRAWMRGNPAAESPTSPSPSTE